MQFLPSIDGLYNLACFCSDWYWLFFSMFSASFRSSCKAGLMVTKSLSICLSVNHFISPSLTKLSLAGYEILGCKTFSLRVLIIGPHSLLACRASAKRFAVSRMDFPCWVTRPFSLYALITFFLHFKVIESDNYVSWGWSSRGLSVCCSLYFLNLNVGLACYVMEVLLENILKSVFFLGSIVPITFQYINQSIFCFFTYSCISWRLSSFLFTIFSLILSSLFH